MRDAEKLEKCAKAAYTTFYLSTGGIGMKLWDEMEPDHGTRVSWLEAVETAIDMRNGRPKIPYEADYVNAVGVQNGRDDFGEYVNAVYALDSEENVAG